MNTASQFNEYSRTHPIPTAICVSADALLPRPDATIIAESGTAPSKGKTIPPIINIR